jgi:hypothetical protein
MKITKGQTIASGYTAHTHTRAHAHWWTHPTPSLCLWAALCKLLEHYDHWLVNICFSQKSFEQFQYALHHQHTSHVNSSTSLIMVLVHIRTSNIWYIRVHSNFKVHLFTVLYTSISFHVNLLHIEIMMKSYKIADTILYCSTDCVSLNWVLTFWYRNLAFKF